MWWHSGGKHSASVSAYEGPILIDPLLLFDLFAETYALLRQHTAGLTHADSLRQPPFSSNTITWIVGHIAATRVNILVGILDVPNRWDVGLLIWYRPDRVPDLHGGAADGHSAGRTIPAIRPT